MSEELKKVELKDEDLEFVVGGKGTGNPNLASDENKDDAIVNEEVPGDDKERLL